jgi:hypothetical protein
MTPTDPTSRPDKGGASSGHVPTSRPDKNAAPSRRVPAPLDSHGHDIHTHDAHHARHGHHDHDGLYNEDVAHEEADVNIRQLITYTIGLAVMCLVSAAIVLGLFNLFERQAARNDPPVSPNALPGGQLATEPRLVENEPLILEKHHEAEAEMLEKYGWVNQAAGVARVPIDEAKKMLLHKGVPVRAGAPADPWMGTHSPAYGESSSGRQIPLRPGPIAPAPGTEAPPPARPPAGEHKAPAAEHKGGF